MYDLKEKEGQIKSKFNAIQAASDLKKNTDGKLKNFDESVENLQDQIGSTIDGFASKAKQKLPNTDNVFEKLSGTLEQILPKKNGDSDRA